MLHWPGRTGEERPQECWSTRGAVGSTARTQSAIGEVCERAEDERYADNHFGLAHVRLASLSAVGKQHGSGSKAGVGKGVRCGLVGEAGRGVAAVD